MLTFCVNFYSVTHSKIPKHKLPLGYVTAAASECPQSVKPLAHAAAQHVTDACSQRLSSDLAKRIVTLRPSLALIEKAPFRTGTWYLEILDTIPIPQSPKGEG